MGVLKRNRMLVFYWVLGPSQCTGRGPVCEPHRPQHHLLFSPLVLQETGKGANMQHLAGKTCCNSFLPSIPFMHSFNIPMCDWYRPGGLDTATAQGGHLGFGDVASALTHVCFYHSLYLRLVHYTMMQQMQERGCLE